MKRKKAERKAVDECMACFGERELRTVDDDGEESFYPCPACSPGREEPEELREAP